MVTMTIIQQMCALEQQQKQHKVALRQRQCHIQRMKYYRYCYDRITLVTTVFLFFLGSLDIHHNRDAGGYIAGVNSFSFTIVKPLHKNHFTATLTSTSRRSIRHLHYIVSRPQQQQQDPPATKLYSSSSNNNNNSKNNDEPEMEQKERNVFDLLFNPYSSTVIPPEIAKDIYIAEGNTTAAQERTQRIILYGIIAFISIILAFFNGFLTELRSNPPPTWPDGTSISATVLTSDSVTGNQNNDQILLDGFGFGWVYSNFVTSFLLTNKIGGILCLLLGGATGLLAEAEYDTRRINAEKIYTELVQRRRNAAAAATGTSKSSGNNNSGSTINKKAKRRSNSKEAKRLNALSEVTLIGATDDKLSPSISDSSTTTTTTEPALPTTTAETTDNSVTDTGTTNLKDDGTANPNILDRVKGFYQQADTMAMTQALLLNKQLEEQGILPKITDETGLKVIPGSASRSSATATTTTAETKKDGSDATKQ